MMPGSKGQKAVHALHDKAFMNLGPAKHEKVAIYVVNRRDLRMFAELRELLRSGAIRRHQLGQDAF